MFSLLLVLGVELVLTPMCLSSTLHGIFLLALFCAAAEWACLAWRVKQNLPRCSWASCIALGLPGTLMLIALALVLRALDGSHPLWHVVSVVDGITLFGCVLGLLIIFGTAIAAMFRSPT